MDGIAPSCEGCVATLARSSVATLARSSVATLARSNVATLAKSSRGCLAKAFPNHKHKQTECMRFAWVLQSPLEGAPGVAPFNASFLCNARMQPQLGSCWCGEGIGEQKRLAENHLLQKGEDALSLCYLTCFPAKFWPFLFWVCSSLQPNLAKRKKDMHPVHFCASMYVCLYIYKCVCVCVHPQVAKTLKIRGKT